MTIPMHRATLHDYFAGEAVQGILAGVMVVDRTSMGGRNKADEAAFLAFAVADAMIALRAERFEDSGAFSVSGTLEDMEILPLATLDDEP